MVCLLYTQLVAGTNPPLPATLAESAQQVTFLELTRARAPHSLYYLHF